PILSSPPGQRSGLPRRVLTTKCPTPPPTREWQSAKQQRRINRAVGRSLYSSAHPFGTSWGSDDIGTTGPDQNHHVTAWSNARYNTGGVVTKPVQHVSTTLDMTPSPP
ncbi:unnamed protein product, partial [Ectocarpus sp. 12 AP-2014]